MISPAQVLAQVVDITKPRFPFPTHICVDANVLYFVFYQSFQQLGAVGGRVPWQYQTRAYPAWISNALKKGTKLFTTPVVMGEFVQLTEYAELEAFWLSDPTTPSGSKFSPLDRKDARYKYWSHLPTIRHHATTLIASARKIVDLLPKLRSESDEMDQAMAQWGGSAGDFADALLVANGKLVRFLDILSDDADLLTFDGITVHTANRNAIHAALTAGKLVN